jgi:hypothetical protein
MLTIVRRPGLEPGSSAWQANILPLNQRRFDFDNHLLALSNCKSSTV